MRVISGTARRLLLETVAGMETRPTTDRIKETLFNMIGANLYDERFLDLFAGSGGIGIEALSRGAKQAVFVDNQKEAIACIKRNLVHTGLIDKSLIMGQNVKTALTILKERKETFGYIFMDPPYENGLEKDALSVIADSTLADKNTTIIVEADCKTKFNYLDEMGFMVKKVKTYKTNQHVFIGRKGE